MRSIKQIMRTGLLAGASALIALANPIIVLADDTSPAATTPAATEPSTPPPAAAAAAATPEPTSTPPATQTPAVTPPAASPTPSTTVPTTTAPLTPPKTTYTYDSDSGRWNSDRWAYDPATGSYKPKPAPVAPLTTTTSGTSAQATIDASTTTAIANALDAAAVSGDASVLRNTTAGSATTGDAASTATIINNVNSSLSSGSNQQAATFATDIMGDVNGDIMLQPMLLKAMLEANAMQSDVATAVKTSTNTGITNDINLNATSGNALVAGNTNAGNATSGTAHTVANVVNVVNSMVASNQSFVGTVNIYGNLNGDILIAPDFIPQLLASNGGSAAVPVGTASVTSNDTQSIVNNIALAAKTGESLVSNNTHAGSATSGNANTNAVIFNLTGHEIVASNSLLVFVNVLGRWVGVIIDAPTGATAAAVGSGVTTNTVSPDLIIDATNTTQLTNNINLSSESGDASVTGNTNAGSATTGNATASANVANISNSSIGTSGWFGILFINVFGNWFGSFGVDTAAGDPIVIQQNPVVGKGSSPLRVMSFIPRIPTAKPVSVVQGASVHSSFKQSQSQSEDQSVAPESSSDDTDDIAGATDTNTEAEPIAPIVDENPLLLFGSLLLIGGSLYGIRRLLG